jgi:hypothetical protein
MHSIAHDVDILETFSVSRELGIPFFLTAHDHLAYTVRSGMLGDSVLKGFGEVWRAAKGRFVISDELGEDYCRRYGHASFTAVTDGLEFIPENPLPRNAASIHVYFMGLVHQAYSGNFQQLLAALGNLVQSGRVHRAKLTCRSGYFPNLAAPQRVDVEVLPFAGDDVVSKEMASCDFLYLPLPFGAAMELFTSYSLSTKMISYLGSGRPILFHGPRNSAAGKLLLKRDAALFAFQPDSFSVETAISSHTASCCVVANALDLARERFTLKAQREKFWSVLLQL